MKFNISDSTSVGLAPSLLATKVPTAHAKFKASFGSFFSNKLLTTLRYKLI